MQTEAIACSDLKMIITGGARGIGAATAHLLASKGAKILIADRLEEEGRSLAAELGNNAIFTKLDVTSETDWRQAAERAQAAFGGLNALFNNAGIVEFAPVDACSPELFRKVLDVNLFGTFLGMHICSPFIARSGGGTIVNMSSTAGLQGYGGLAAYVTSKWGVRGLTKAAALDLADMAIRVISLHPGPVRTKMTEDLNPDIVTSQPIARFGEPAEIARMAKFIFTEATYSTGSEFTADGGAVTGAVLAPMARK